MLSWLPRTEDPCPGEKIGPNFTPPLKVVTAVTVPRILPSSQDGEYNSSVNFSAGMLF